MAARILPSGGGGPCLRQMGIKGLAPGPRTSVPAKGHKSYPYLLRDLKITRPNQVWACNITYVPKPSRYLYLTAVITSFSRHVLAWPLSNSMDVELRIEAGDEALSQGRPQISNTDQGSHYTSQEFNGRLLSASIQISMEGKGRALDNVMIERLWRSVKYEEIYLKSYENGADCDAGLKAYFHYYTHERPYQGLGHQTPWEAFQTTT